MAKLYYSADYGTISLRADDDTHGLQHDIEITAEQAIAFAVSQLAAALSNLHDPISEIRSAIADLARSK
jgi:hypothetical protein